MSSLTCKASKPRQYMCKCTVLGLGLGSMIFETMFLRESFPLLYEHTHNVPKVYALVILFNVIASGIALSFLADKVIAARELYTKDDKEGAIFDYPNLYAEGNSLNARKFNAIQRGHQYALETYTQFLILSLIGGLEFPVCVAVGGLIWIANRLHYAQFYADNLYPTIW